jgi:methylenetetrahydrofolate dehydrogenase (NADP+) / methenyltetrahydrofolate cyclohydrolase
MYNNKIAGREVLAKLLAQVKNLTTPTVKKEITIVVFDISLTRPDEGLRSKHQAALDSTEQKRRIFDSIGFFVNIVPLDYSISRLEFEKLIIEKNEDETVAAIIVQYPMNREVREVLEDIHSSKDIDGLRTNNVEYNTCATGDAICRVVSPFLDHFNLPRVAINGEYGFVGRAVGKSLEARIHQISLLLHIDLEYKGLKYKERKSRVDNIKIKIRERDDQGLRDSDIIISVTGQKDVLNEDIVRTTHKLIVDGSYIPVPLADRIAGERHIFSDLKRSVRYLPQKRTPVPGGVGPLEMAVLAERLIKKKYYPNLISWSLNIHGEPIFPEWDQIPKRPD